MKKDGKDWGEFVAAKTNGQDTVSPVTGNLAKAEPITGSEGSSWRGRLACASLHPDVIAAQGRH